MELDAAVFHLDRIVAGNGLLERLLGGAADTLVGPLDALLGVHVVFVRHIARQIGRLERDGVLHGEGLDGLHQVVLDLGRAVHRYRIKAEGAVPPDGVVVGLGVVVLVVRPAAGPGGGEPQLGIGVAVEEPEGHIHALDLVDTEICRLSESQSYRLAVCIPMADYQRLVLSGDLQMLLIGLFIAFFVVFCCIYFHRHILSPAFRQLEEDRQESRRRMDELQLERQQMQTELSRLADVCRNESVPDAFQTFVAGIPTLTKTERRIFDGYAAGLRTREIAQQLDIKDSTLRFHNKNIYDKLGVSSLKQLQQFVAILNSGSDAVPDKNEPFPYAGRK